MVSNNFEQHTLFKIIYKEYCPYYNNTMPTRSCECCNFSTKYKNVFDKHLSSKRHIDTQNNNNTMNFECNICSKKYKYRSGLWQHSQTCVKPPSEEVVSTNVTMNQLIEKISEIQEQCNNIVQLQSDKIIQLQEQSKITIQNKNVKQTTNYIYLLQEREFIKTNEKIYKVGMTKQNNFKRFEQYPKGSVLLFQMCCDDSKNMETVIIKKFKECCKQRLEIGNEYFEGDSKNMIDIIYSTIKNEKEDSSVNSSVIKTEITNSQLSSVEEDKPSSLSATLPTKNLSTHYYFESTNTAISDAVYACNRGFNRNFMLYEEMVMEHQMKCINMFKNRSAKIKLAYLFVENSKNLINFIRDAELQKTSSVVSQEPI